MHRVYIFVVLFLVSFMLVGCVSDRGYEIDSIGLHSSMKVLVTADGMTIPEIDNSYFTTGGVLDENSITDACIILFDENDCYLDVSLIVNNKVNIAYTKSKRSLYVVANAYDIIDQKSKQWTIGSTTMAQVEQSLIISKSIGQDMPSMPFAMYAKLVFNNGVDKNSAITSDGTHTGAPLLLRRNVAKVSVSIGNILSSNFVIDGVMLCKAPDEGYMLNNSPFQGSTSSNYKMYAPGTDLYSFASDAQTTLIIEGRSLKNGVWEEQPRYYKLAIKESQSHGAMGLKHNNWYKIIIVNKSGDGFATLDGAINGHVLDHIDITLEVQDITMHDFKFGKDFFIATSNTYYEQYGYAIGRNLYEICKVRFASFKPDIYPLGTTSIEVLSGDIQLSSATIDSVTNAHNHETISIKAYFNKDATDATIRIKFNNMVKDIFVKSRPQLDLRTDQFVEIPYSVTGSISDMSATWCGLNDQKTFTQNKNIDMNNALGATLYVTIQSNPNLFDSRSVNAMVSRSITGMTKISIYQNPENNLLYTNSSGQLSVGNAMKATRDKILFFKYGSVIGFNNTEYSGSKWKNSFITFNPSKWNVDQHITTYHDATYGLPGIPCFDDTDKMNVADVSSVGYHNAINIRNGKGDPCMLVGLTASNIRAMTEDQLSSYRSGYRMPTNKEQLEFAGLTNGGEVFTNAHWWRASSVDSPLSGVDGAEFPSRKGYLGFFLPAAGVVSKDGTINLISGGLLNYGYYWTNGLSAGGTPLCLEFSHDHINADNGIGFFYEGMPIRCIRTR